MHIGQDHKKQNLLTILWTVLFLFIFQQVASKIGGLVADMFSYEQIDKFGVFAWISIHHIMQMLLALVAILVCKKAVKVDFGFRLGNLRLGLKYVMVFTSIIFLYVLITYFIGYLSGSIQSYDYPLDVKNVVGSLGFQMFLSGTSEEILFRALPITLLISMFGDRQGLRIGRLQISPWVLVAAILFSLAHVSWTVSPFSITANWFQIVYALVLGVCYGITYVKSKSIVYPVLMHSVSNVLMVGLGYLFAVIY